MLGYDEYSFFMTRVGCNTDGSFEVAEEETDLERGFVGLRYKSLSGLGDYGAVKSVYAEDYAEEDGVDVYFGSGDVVREQTEYKLSLYFFCADESVTDIPEQCDVARSVYESFMDFVSGGLLVYRDTVRQRRALMYLDEASEPSTDNLLGRVYLAVTFTFKSVLGRSYPLDDTTIQDYLGVESLPVYGS